MIVASVFAFFILLALASFHPGDPGWSQAGLQLDVHNWVGATGAWVADLLLFSFGWLAYLLPFCFAFIGWFLFQHVKDLDEFDYLTIGLRIIGGLLIALGVTICITFLPAALWVMSLVQRSFRILILPVPFFCCFVFPAPVLPC